MGEFTDTLLKLPMETLVTLHKALCDKVVSIFPQLKEKRIINRKKTWTIVPDIYHLSISIVNGMESKDLESIFLDKETPVTDLGSDGTPATEELAELLKVVTALSNRVSSLEREVAELRRNPSLDGRSSSSSNTLPKTVDLETEDPEETPSEEGDFEEPSDRKSKKRRRKHGNNGTTSAAPSAAVPESSATPAAPAAAGSPAYAQASSQPAVTLRAALPAQSTDSRNAPSPLQAAALSSDTVDIYVGGVSPTNNTSDIETHLRGMGVSQCRVKALRETSTWKSFKATVPTKYKAAALDARNWPANLRLRPFHPRRRDGTSGNWGAREPSGRHATPHNKRYERRDGTSGNWGAREPSGRHATSHNERYERQYYRDGHYDAPQWRDYYY